ncbi:hypothetical protein [Ralstonia solanacearum]|uniref:hypothetical protein n=1 Tax=Ralstonia solanacearum TaxID=305 RepID=UPI002306B4E8|nr:hypothetical protein [Ralstonia solanacearum]MDB0533445.1 hypothetical protein [Ralstonia solanacearum]MDB0563133.1 hypothetical protein [Ralstonia solanacearum]
MFGDLPHLDAPQHFFSAPLTFTHGRFDLYGRFHPIVEACGAVRCHLSPVDALIEVVQMMQIGMECQVVPAAVVDPSHFKGAGDRGYRADLHLGWPACNGKLMLRFTGRLATYSRVLTSNQAVEPSPTCLQVDEDSLAAFSRLREFAGLFAWSETITQILQWDAERLTGVVRRVLDTIDIEHGDASQVNQIAMFDPEFEQWHFVALNLAEPNKPSQ